MARFDTLTGLANRAEAISRLEAALGQPPAEGTHLGILFCDIDHFKTINDTWARHRRRRSDNVGGRHLRIRASRRHSGRTGGDEMLVVLPDVHSIDEVARIGEQIRRRAAEPIHASGGTTIHVTLSIGATIADPGESVS